MHAAEALGYLASGLVLTTFCMGTMTRLRLVAIASNLAFAAYGLALDLEPIVLLHATLLPINVWRLLELWRSHPQAGAAGGPEKAAS